MEAGIASHIWEIEEMVDDPVRMSFSNQIERRLSLPATVTSCQRLKRPEMLELYSFFITRQTHVMMNFCKPAMSVMK
jgi:hypothetical protein